MLLHYIKRYPFSLTLITFVVYLSFFRPPSVGVQLFLGIDKLAHFLMYAGVSGCLWLEFFFNHRKEAIPIHHAIVGTIIAPILFSGIVELLQATLTKYRGGEWLDFFANTCGVIAATLIAWYIVKPIVEKKRKDNEPPMEK